MIGSVCRWAFICGVVCLLLAGSARPAAAQDTTIPVSPPIAQELTSLLGQAEVLAPALAPDGSRLAWFNNQGGPNARTTQICVYTFELESTSCFILTGEFFGTPYQLQWSPDAMQIAFSENPVEPSNESDIWLFDLESETLINLTDDGLTDSWRQWDDETDVLVDYLPMWNQADGELYFWRVIPQGQHTFEAGIYRLDAESGEAVLVHDASDRLGGGVPAFDDDQIGLDGISAISPDGSTLATITLYSDGFGVIESSLFLIDLTDPEAWPNRVLTDIELRAALPTWESAPLIVRGLAWAVDGAGVLVMSKTDEEDNDTPFTLLHYVDAASGTVLPVIDYSDIEIEDYDGLVESTNLPLRMYATAVPSLAPAGYGVTLANDLGGIGGIMALLLPPDGNLPPLLGSAGGVSETDSIAVSHASDGKVVIYGYLLDPEAE
jgi:dipeptidyl aminopeptidase/acylaminoacyl peptidase